ESFGSNQFPDTNDDPTAVFNEELVRAGIVITASSGDAGDFNTIGSPASTPGVISVGGTTMFRSYAQTTGSGFQLSNGKYRSNAISALSSSGFTQPGRTIDLVAPGDLGWALCSTDVDIYQNCFDNKDEPSPIQQFGHQPVGAADRRGRGPGHPGVPGQPPRRQPERGPGPAAAHQHLRGPRPAGLAAGRGPARLAGRGEGRPVHP